MQFRTSPPRPPRCHRQGLTGTVGSSLTSRYGRTRSRDTNIAAATGDTTAAAAAVPPGMVQASRRLRAQPSDQVAPKTKSDIPKAKAVFHNFGRANTEPAPASNGKFVHITRIDWKFTLTTRRPTAGGVLDLGGGYLRTFNVKAGATKGQIAASARRAATHKKLPSRATRNVATSPTTTVLKEETAKSTSTDSPPPPPLEEIAQQVTLALPPQPPAAGRRHPYSETAAACLSGVFE